MNVFNLSLLTFSVISTVLYVAVLAVVQRNRKIVPFKGHFFCLIKALGFVDLTGIINLHVYSLFRYWLWLDFDWLFYHQSLGWWACLWSYLGTTYTGVNHCFAVFFIAINRYLNISNHQVELWRGRMCRLALLVQFSAPALIVAPLCFQEFFVIDIPVGPNNTYPAARIKDKDFEMIYYLFVNGVLMRDVDADYYGYMDDDDGVLIPIEKIEEAKAIARAVDEWKERKESGIEEQTERGESPALDEDDDDIYNVQDDSFENCPESSTARKEVSRSEPELPIRSGGLGDLLLHSAAAQRSPVSSERPQTDQLHKRVVSWNLPSTSQSCQSTPKHKQQMTLRPSRTQSLVQRMLERERQMSNSDQEFVNDSLQLKPSPSPERLGVRGSPEKAQSKPKHEQQMTLRPSRTKSLVQRVPEKKRQMTRSAQGLVNDSLQLNLPSPSPERQGAWGSPEKAQSTSTPEHKFSRKANVPTGLTYAEISSAYQLTRSDQQITRNNDHQRPRRSSSSQTDRITTYNLAEPPESSQSTPRHKYDTTPRPNLPTSSSSVTIYKPAAVYIYGGGPSGTISSDNLSLCYTCGRSNHA